MRHTTLALLCLALGGILVTGAWTSLSPQATSASVNEAIKAHFQKVPAELERYEKIRNYGETVSGTKPSPEDVSKEVALFKEATAAGLLKKPSRELILLGHNLVIHDPPTGEAYLKAVLPAMGPTDMESCQMVSSSIIAAGESGESILVAALPAMSAEQRNLWSRALSVTALYASSIPGIQALIAAEQNPSTKASLIMSLFSIGSPSSLPAVQELIEKATDDKVQGAAIFAYVEIAGFDGIGYLEKVKPLGAEATKQQKEGLSWLREDTSAKSKHGTEVNNDPDFAKRFGDLKSAPVIQWMNGQGLMSSSAKQLDAATKRKLLEILIDAKGFGLEAAKGSLFLSLAPEDEPQLTRIRAVSFYSPNGFSQGRAKTIGILVRTARRGK